MGIETLYSRPCTKKQKKRQKIYMYLMSEIEITRLNQV